MKNKLLIGTLFILFYVFSVTFAYYIGNSRNTLSPPPDWSNPNGYFVIQMKGKNYVAIFHTGPYKREEFIGNSKVNLKEHLGKKVKISGKFPSTEKLETTNTQCIVDNCHEIFSEMFWSSDKSTTYIDIDSIGEYSK